MTFHRIPHLSTYKGGRVQLKQSLANVKRRPNGKMNPSPTQSMPGITGMNAPLDQLVEVSGNTMSNGHGHAMLPMAVMPSEKAIQALGIKQHGSDFKKWGTDENEFADFYVGSDYQEFNKKLTKIAQGDTSVTLSSEQKKMWTLANKFATPIGTDMTLYRFSKGYADVNAGFDVNNPQKYVGKIQTIDKLTSTAHTVEKGSSYFAGREFFTVYRVPATTKAINLSSYNSSEKEIVLAPGQKTRVKSVKRIPGINGGRGYWLIEKEII